MYSYIVSTRTYISKKHANNEDYSDEEFEETQMTDHITNIYFVTSSVEKALEKAKTSYFGKNVQWCKYATNENIIEKFEMIRKLTPECPTMGITEEIGYIMENPKLIGEFITITQVQLV